MDNFVKNKCIIGQMNDTIDVSKLAYRRAVIGIVIDDNYNFLITQLIDYGENDWRFAGGGVEEESSDKALLRELKEELGSTNFNIVKKSKIQIKYDWPMSVIETRLKNKGKTYKGQVQDQYLVEFKGNKTEIKINPTEIRQIKWVKFSELESHFNFPRQWTEAKETIKELIPNIT